MKILAVLQGNIPSTLLEGHIAESAARTFWSPRSYFVRILHEEIMTTKEAQQLVQKHFKTLLIRVNLYISLKIL